VLVGTELHGLNMDGMSHLRLHLMFGTDYESGLALGNFDALAETTVLLNFQLQMELFGMRIWR